MEHHGGEGPAASSGRELQRVLTWRFTRGSEALECRLGLDVDALLYEFSVRRIDQRRSTWLERFTQVSHAFAHQAAYEALLIEDGWTLESCST